MGAFLSGEDVARRQDVDSTYLKQSEAVSDYVRRSPYDEDQKGMISGYKKYTDDGIAGVRGGYVGTMKKIDEDYRSDINKLKGGYENNLLFLNTDLSSKFGESINALKGTYNGSLSDLEEALKGTYKGSLSDLETGYNSQFDILKDDYEGNLTKLQQSFKDDVDVLKGTYKGSLSELENGYNNQFASLKGTYTGNLSGLETKLSGNLDDAIGKLRGTYTDNLSNLKVNLSNEFNDELVTLKAAYKTDLSVLDSRLTKDISDRDIALRGGYEGNLSSMRTESNSKYATIDQLFNEFKNQTYATDKADILRRAKEIKDLINKESSDIKSKFDTELAAFKADYNQRLGTYALNSRVDNLNKTIDAGLTAEEIFTIKTIINSSNFSNLFKDLKTRGIITDTVVPAPAAFLRHLRSRNYVIY